MQVQWSGSAQCMSLLQVLGLVARVSPKLRAPIILFQYYNPILRRGPDEYCRLAKEAGAAGEFDLVQQHLMRAGCGGGAGLWLHSTGGAAAAMRAHSVALQVYWCPTCA